MNKPSVLTSKKAIFFDYGGTLDAPGTAWKERFFLIYQRHGINIDRQTFTQAFYKSDDSLVAERPVHLNLTQIVHEQVSRVFEHLKISDRALKKKIAEEFIAESLANIKKNLPILKRLKERFRLGIISNNYGNLQAISDETGLSELMDALIDSNLVGEEKPHPKIFEKGLEALGVTPDSSIMVGDNVKRDIYGALQVGMQPILITDGNIPSDMSIPDVPVIQDMGQLLQIINRS